jgi:LPXTG-site transpeptidase (sortase) family protein
METADVDSSDGATPPASPRRGVRIGRLVVAVGLAAVVLLVVADVLVGRLAFTTRQDHRAGIYNDPTIEQPDRGGPVMVLQIDEAGINLVVAEGSDGDVLRGGPGLVEGSPLPGEGGNVVVMGRSTRFGGPFDFVKQLVEDTEIVVRLRAGQVARYEVVDTRTVKGDDLSVLEQTDEEQLTLVTSAGGPFDSRRRVAVAELTGLSGGAAPAIAENATATDGAAERDPGNTPQVFDVRAPLAGAMLLAGILVVALGAVAIGDLRRRHPTATVVVVAGPAIALGLVLVLFHLDAFLPVSY